MKSTKSFVSNAPFIFSSYISKDQNRIVRHFIKSTLTPEFQKMQFNYIPLTPGEFYSHVHWQNGLLSGLTNKNNKCLINLLAKSDTIQIAESCKNREPSRVSFSQNVFYMYHTFGKIVGNLLVSNSKVIIEALCRKGTLLKKIRWTLGHRHFFRL